MIEQQGEPFSDTDMVRRETNVERDISRADDRSQREEADVVIEDSRLSEEQLRIARDLRRLYHSLCGAVVGQYWPQALLDSAGRFNRPPFPHRPPPRRDFPS